MMHSDALNPFVEDYLSAAPPARDAARKAVLSALAAAEKAGRFSEVAAALPPIVAATDDYNSLINLHRLATRLRKADVLPAPSLRLTVAGSVTAQPLASFVELSLLAGNLTADLHVADFGVYRQEILNPHSALCRHGPQVLWLIPTWRDLAHVPALGDSRARVEECVAAELAGWQALWQTAHEHLGCQIVQDNFVPPPWRTLDNHERRHAGGLGRYVDLVNQGLAELAPPFVTVHDAAHLAASEGLARWADPRVWHYGKLPCALECLAPYARSVASVLLALRGRARKCLVLDLDNTLWGGIVGDDGPAGLELGPGSPRGEAFAEFQRYVQALCRRGVILAVCSKNDEDLARQAFTTHPGMVLRIDDIACFIANWDDKAANLRRIAERLNIGLDSLVLADDNPAERHLVRRQLPQIAVPELPQDPSGFIAALERHHYFQTVALADEDLARTGQYRGNAQRAESLAAAPSLPQFLRELRMTAHIAPIDGTTLPRAAQLINKTNQFNLTLRRYSVSELEALASDPAWVTRTVALADRFGDNGLISVLLGRREGAVLHIDTWVMSCRVFQRTVEHLLMNHLVDLAAAMGITTLRGSYLAGPRNSLVAELYPSLGFGPAGDAWKLSLSPRPAQLETFVETNGQEKFAGMQGMQEIKAEETNERG